MDKNESKSTPSQPPVETWEAPDFEDTDSGPGEEANPDFESVEENQIPAPDLDELPLEGAHVDAVLVDEEIPFDVSAAIVELQESIARLESNVMTGFAESDKRDHTIDILHTENQENKQDLIFEATKPLLRGLFTLHDTMLDTLTKAESDPVKMDREKLVSELDFFQQDVLDILMRQGIEPFEDEPGTPFNGTRHVVEKPVPVDNKDDHAKIIKVVKKGFGKWLKSSGSTDNSAELKLKVFRYVSVLAGKYTPKPTVSDTPELDSTENQPTNGGENCES